MNVKSIKIVYFSPCGSTKKVLEILADSLPIKGEKINITSYSAQEINVECTESDLLILGIPVYGGRVPAPVLERLKNFQGKNSLALLCAVYGNRAYEDALAELKEAVEERGFVPIAAGAFIGEHSIMNTVATNRPDHEDIRLIQNFARQAWEKIAYVPEHSQFVQEKAENITPYREYNGLPLKPRAGNKCTGCKICAKLCPVQAIPESNPKETFKEKCITCMSCVRNCPEKARKLNPLLHFFAEKSFYKKYHERVAPEFIWYC